MDEVIPVGPTSEVEFESGNGAVVEGVDDRAELLIPVMLPHGRTVVELDAVYGAEPLGETVSDVLVPGSPPLAGNKLVEFAAGYGTDDVLIHDTTLPVPRPALEVGKVVELPAGYGADDILLSGFVLVKLATGPVPGKPPLEATGLVELSVGNGGETVLPPPEVVMNPGVGVPDPPVPGTPSVGPEDLVTLPVGYGAEMALLPDAAEEVEREAPEIPVPGILPVPLKVGPVELVPGYGGGDVFEIPPTVTVDVFVTGLLELPVPKPVPVDM
ncbi:hypothetical protein QBC42DRAFT_281982 [Cladorrhinum samala]|uniref:Uncharacterized protein n=1 Tax=Cladorrhinum samala TaxID=585594 RepID=A0AAV9I1Q3_9PEZI|nr:hypothetical protein QBC42DRAFT_281982 [Cladorrhinum samala]